MAERRRSDPALADLVLVGQIAGAFGVKGEVRIRPFTAEPEGVVAYGPLLDGDGRPLLTPKTWRALGGGLAVTAPEVKTREQAEALRGVRLHVPRAALPAPEADEFYAVDLIGCTVETTDGEPCGIVVAVHDFGAGELMEIRRDGKPALFAPFTLAAAPIIDIAGKRIVITPPAETEAP